jgi:orotate phosphoribosyltransferase
MSNASIAAALLDIGAVTVSPYEPYTWASGLKSPIYCDNRKTLGYPVLRNQILSAFLDIARTYLEADTVIAGTATAGIPHGMLLAYRLDLPFCYVRSKAKEHGTATYIEGAQVLDRSVILVEDLVSTGGSSIQAAAHIHDSGGALVHILSIFSYELPLSTQRFSEKGLTIHSLTGLTDLMAVLHERHPDWVEPLRAWREDPQAWSARMTA